MKFKLILAICALSSFNAFAEGGWTSGGGNAVVCFDSPSIPKAIRENGGDLKDGYFANITSVEMFDLYQARQRQGLDGVIPAIVPIGEKETFKQYYNKIAKRLFYTTNGLYEILYTSSQNLPSSNIIWQDRGLSKIDDVNSVGQIDTENCVLATMAAQYRVSNQYYLHLDQRLFAHEKHSELSKAVLLLHEYVYQKARDQGQTDSRNTRLLVRRLISNDPAVKMNDILTEAQQLGFIKFENFHTSFYQQLQPNDVLFRAAYWVRMAGYEAHMNYWNKNGDSISSLIEQAVNLIRKTRKVNLSIATLNESAAYLKLHDDGTKAYTDLIDKISNVLIERALFAQESMMKSKANLLKGINENPFLTVDAKEVYSETFDRFVQLIARLSKLQRTKDEIQYCKKPSGAVFLQEVGVCEMSDLNVFYFQGDAIQKDLAEKWVNENIRVLLIHAQNAYDIFEETMPVLK